MYRTCVGCAKQGEPCEARDVLKGRLAGLGVTSIKWRCKDREARFQIGDPVWASTVGDQNEVDDDGEPYRDHYPGHIIRDLGSTLLIYIEPGAPGRECQDDVPFSPRANGFCKIPLSRLEAREGDRETICKHCEWPSFKGHQSGYSCSARCPDCGQPDGLADHSGCMPF